MTNHNTFFKHFDMPVKHLDADFHYVPPKARSEQEIERRRSLPTGTLLAEFQQRGLEVATRVISFCADADDGDFAADTLAAASFNTAWHNHAEGATGVMRRRLFLPQHELKDVVSRRSILEAAEDRFISHASLAKALRNAVAERSCLVLRRSRALGANLGDTALLLAAAKSAGEIEMARGDKTLMQRATRAAALDTLEESRILCAEVGANPTLAQLADPDSPLSVYWRREGTNAAVEALEYATTVDIAA